MRKVIVSSKFTGMNLIKTYLNPEIEVIVDDSCAAVTDINTHFIVTGNDGTFDLGRDVYDWNFVLSEFVNYVTDMYLARYDYFYLKNALADSLRNPDKALVTGSSYGGKNLVGDSSLINTSLDSKDLYYSMKEIEKCCVEGQCKKVVLVIAYYIFYCDLSLTHTEISRVENVYYPIFNDLHNAMFVRDIPQNPHSTIWNFNNIVDSISMMQYEDMFHSTYYNETIKRGAWEKWNKDCQWGELSDEEKEEYVVKRTNRHNSALKFKKTYDENMQIFQRIFDICAENNVSLYIIAPPHTSEYLRHLDPAYKKDYMNALNSVTGEADFWDFNDMDIFEPDDFLDSDHLNEKGAEKFTMVLKDILSGDLA